MTNNYALLPSTERMHPRLLARVQNVMIAKRHDALIGIVKAIDGLERLNEQLTAYTAILRDLHAKLEAIDLESSESALQFKAIETAISAIAGPFRTLAHQAT